MRKKSKKVGFRIAKVYCTGTGTTSAGEKPEKTLAAYITVGPGNPLELDKDRGKYPPFIDGISPPPPTVGSDPPEGPNTDLQLCLFSCPVKDIVFPNCSVYPVDAFLAGGIEPRVEKIQDLLNEFSAAAGSPPMFPERPTTMSPLSHGVFGLATAARLQEIMLPLLSKLQKAIKELADIYLDCNYSELFPPAVPIPGTDPPKYRGMPLINLPPVPADTGSIFPGGTITLQANPTMPGGAELNNFIHGLPNLLQGGLFAALGAPQHFNEIPPLFEGGATFLEDALGIANLATTNPGLPGMQKGMESNCIKLGNPLGPGVSLGNWSDSRGAYIPPGSLNGQFPPQIVKGDFTTKRQNPFSMSEYREITHDYERCECFCEVDWYYKKSGGSSTCIQLITKCAPNPPPGFAQTGYTAVCDKCEIEIVGDAGKPFGGMMSMAEALPEYPVVQLHTGTGTGSNSCHAR